MHVICTYQSASNNLKMIKIKTEGSRCSWTKRETAHLLGLMKAHKVMDLLDGKTRRNKNVYVLLSQELANKGFDKSCEQVKLKFRTLKQQFLKIKRNNSKSGSARHTMENYKELEELLGNRPVAAAIGLDTTIVEDMLSVSFEEGDIEEPSISGVVSEDMEYLEDEEEPSISGVFSENVEYLEGITNGSEACGSQNTEKARKKKRSAVQLTLLEIAEDIKESHAKTLKMLEDENVAFLAEQRRLMRSI